MPFAHYQPAQRDRLQALLQTPEWRELLSNPRTLEQYKAETITPEPPPSQLASTAQYLIERNTGRALDLIRSGVTEEKTVLRALSNWEAALEGETTFPILFLGLVLTLDCSFAPPCVYCNQSWLPRRLNVEEWKGILRQAASPTPPYVYMTGGDPFLLDEELWGDEGLVAFASGLGCAVNINTNAALISPRVALQLVKTGLFKVHISIDTADPQVQAELFGGRDRVEKVWQGLLNLQIARAMLGAGHPQVHINCVLTRLNLFQFPQLLNAILEVRQIRSGNYDGKVTEDPIFNDFAFHLIPIGGANNAPLRPTAQQWLRFYTETWAEAEQVWQDYQARVAVPEEDRKTLDEHVPFANPFRRVEHRMSLEAYCERAAEGDYWQNALTERCYVVPTQAFVLPDGSQHWCGAHAIGRPSPLGNVRKTGLRENIQSNLDHLADMPNECCYNCAGATCVINQATERKLTQQIAQWLKDRDQL